MKSRIQIMVCGLLSMILFSCEHKDLCYHHPHVAVVKLEFDWKNAPQANPEGMCVFFYPEEGGEPVRFDFTGKTGGEIDIKVGRYKVLCYNNDTEAVQFRGMEDFNAHEGYTRDGNVVESIYGNAAHYAPPAKGAEDERVVICPDMMWGCNALNVEITEAGLSYECVPFEDKDKTEWMESTEHIITLYPAELICTYTYEVRNVKNMEYMTQACGSLSGMAPSIRLADEELGKECVTVPFETNLHPENSTMTGMFYTFGHHEENMEPHMMALYVWYSNKEKFYTTFDVTDQVHSAPDKRHVHIIIDNAEFPEPLPEDGGFDVEVDDWQEVENDIIM